MIDNEKYHKAVDNILKEFPGHNVIVVLSDPKSPDACIASNAGEIATIMLLEKAAKKMFEQHYK